MALGLLIAIVTLAVSNMLIRQEQARTENEKLRAEQALNLAENRAEHNRRELERLKAANTVLDRGRVYTEWTRWDDADAAFTAAIVLRPDLAPAWAERGRLFARLGLWDMAAADFAQLHELQPPALSRDWWHCALLLAHTGEQAAYQSLCDRMLERFAGTNATSFTIDLARTVSLMPVSEIEPRRVVSLVEEALGTSESEAHDRFALAIACFRAGDFERAAREGEALVESSSDGSMRSAIPVLAMAYQALGRKEEARRALDKASEIV
jgi:tetratricopeptide (TPR) repeat protein